MDDALRKDERGPDAPPKPVRHTIVLSDFHMSPASPDHPWWMRYRNRAFFVDREYSALIDRLLAKLAEEAAPEDALEVVFNGDMFELDGADAFLNGKGRRDHDLGSEDAEARAMEAVLGDHDGFVTGTARLLLRADRVVFLAGNHDIGLYWPAVRAVLRDHLVRAALALDPDADADTLRARIVFRQWFHRTAGGVYVEHGQQYDPSSSVPDPLVPRRADGRGLWLSFGSAGFRHILGGIGTMNPHDHNTFIMSGLGYLRHWVRYYFRRGRSLAGTWLLGSLRCARHMLGQRTQRSEPTERERERALDDLSEVTDLPPRVLRRLRGLQARPVTDRPYAVLRELWLDRVGIAAVIGLVSLLGLLLLPWPVDFVVTALAALTFWLYERHAPASDIMAFEERLGDVADAITTLTGDRVVVLGHTHHAGLQDLPGGGRLVNTGTWAPAFLDPECTRRAETEHPVAWVRSDPGGVVAVDLLVWESGRFLAWVGDGDRNPPPDADGDQPEVSRAA